MPRLALTICTVVILAVALGSPALASEGTPATGPGVPPRLEPEPSDCTVAPRPAAFFRDLAATPPIVGSPTSTPFAQAGGSPADESVGAAAAATVIEAAACRNTGDLRRLAALYTDAFFQRNAGRFGAAVEALAREAAGSPVPVAREDRVAIVAIPDVRVLPDGRVDVLVVAYEPELGAEVTIFYALERVGNRYLIDEHVLDPFGERLAPGTPTDASLPPPWA